MKKTVYPIRDLSCPRCGVKVNPDSGNMHNNEYICSECDIDFIITKDRRIHIVNPPKSYGAVTVISILLGLIGLVTLYTSNYQSDILLLGSIFLLTFFAFGAQLLKGLRHGVMTFRLTVYEVHNPTGFKICLWFSFSVWIFFNAYLVYIMFKMS